MVSVLRSGTVAKDGAAENNKGDFLADFVVNPAEEFFDVIKGNVAHMSNAESLFFELAVTVSENGIVLLLDGIDGLSDIDASGIFDRGEGV